MYVLHEFKVNDCAILEKLLHSKLKSFLVLNSYEFLNIPYNLLIKLIELIINSDEKHNEAINDMIDMVNELRSSKFDESKWTNGIDLSVFESRKNDSPLEANATDDQKQKFVLECIEKYKLTLDSNETVVWKKFNEYLFKQLNILKYKYKANMWKIHFNDVMLKMT